MKRRHANEDHPESSSLSSKKRMQESSEEPCEKCGSVGIADLMMLCFKCRDTREHTYCARVFLPFVPLIWICEACRSSSRVLLIPGVADDQMESETTVLDRSLDPENSLSFRVDDHETAKLRTNDTEVVIEDQMNPETTVVDRSLEPKISLSSRVDDHETAKLRTNGMEEAVDCGTSLQPHTSPLAKETLSDDSSQNNEKHQPSQAFPVDGQTHHSLISSLDQIFNRSASPKCKS